jgi:hypothetical protein
MPKFLVEVQAVVFATVEVEAENISKAIERAPEVISEPKCGTSSWEYLDGSLEVNEQLTMENCLDRITF